LPNAQDSKYRGGRPHGCHLATPAIAAKAKREHIHLEPRFSDHAPLVIDYDFSL
jgi:exonuclease III